MAEPPELWTFVLANTGLFLVSSLLTTLSFVAYRQSGGRWSYLLATAGFGFVILGGLVEPLYQLVVAGDYDVSGAELLWLQAGEGVLIAIGLGLLYVAITNHGRGATPAPGAQVRAGGGEIHWQREDD